MTEIKASDCKCSDCNEQAVAFWPVCDPDIPSNPYCRKCLDKIKARIYMRIFELDKKEKRYKNEGAKIR